MRPHKIGLSAAWAAKWGLRRMGLEIRRAGPGRFPDLADFLAARQVAVVLDIGANRGQFGTALRKRGYRGQIVSFEPIEAVYREIEAVAARDGNWKTHHLALGAAPGRAVLNVSRDSEFSSMLDQSPAALRYHTETVVIGREQVSVACLDDIYAMPASGAVFLKVDTQGYERFVLDGAREVLRQVVGVQMELPIVHLYENSWSLTEALTYMDDAGFALAQVLPISWLKEDRVSAVEIDAVFRRK